MEMQKTTIRLPKKLLVTTKKQALEEGLSLQEIISQGILLRLNLDSSNQPTDAPNQGRLHAAYLLEFVEKLEFKPPTITIVK